MAAHALGQSGPHDCTGTVTPQSSKDHYDSRRVPDTVAETFSESRQYDDCSFRRQEAPWLKKRNTPYELLDSQEPRFSCSCRRKINLTYEIRNNTEFLNSNVKNCSENLLFDIRICFVLRYLNFVFAALPHEASSVAIPRISAGRTGMRGRLFAHCYG